LREMAWMAMRQEEGGREEGRGSDGWWIKLEKGEGGFVALVVVIVDGEGEEEKR
jgi:hypothetical protein